MNRAQPTVARLMLLVLLIFMFWQASLTARDRLQSPERSAIDLFFFDVAELPVRIDEPKLEADGKRINITCAVANRQSEELLGFRFLLLVFDASGKLRTRVSWTERSVLSGFSIKRTRLQPTGIGNLRAGDRLMLGIDEVIGRETIWHATGEEKALRAYVRGNHDVVPEVQTAPNKYDSPPAQLPLIRVRPQN